MAAAPETAVVGTFHIVPKSQIARQSSRGLALYEHKLLKRFQTVISVSPAAQTFARQVYGLTCIVEPNVIDLIPYRQVPGKSAGNQIVTIVFLGRLVERKGCEYLLRAIVELKDRPQLKPFRVLIGGRGPLEPRLKRFAWDHGLNKLVEFNGFIDEADKPEFLAQADLAIFPSTAGESFGIVLLEAMAAAPGVVLAGDNEGYASVMQPHIEQLFAPRQSQLLAEKIAYYIQNKSARQAAHRWQTRHVEQFDVNVVGPRIIDLYNQALRHRRDVR
jgi:phosphatidylinositol alpha-mannosyltransferase